jgi:hypothetical protein
MQNLTQIIMQKWGRIAARQATSRDALLLTTSAMMAMLLVGCSGSSETKANTITVISLSEKSISHSDTHSYDFNIVATQTLNKPLYFVAQEIDLDGRNSLQHVETPVKPNESIPMEMQNNSGSITLTYLFKGDSSREPSIVFEINDGTTDSYPATFELKVLAKSGDDDEVVANEIVINDAEVTLGQPDNFGGYEAVVILTAEAQDDLMITFELDPMADLEGSLFDSNGDKLVGGTPYAMYYTEQNGQYEMRLSFKTGDMCKPLSVPYTVSGSDSSTSKNGELSFSVHDYYYSQDVVIDPDNELDTFAYMLDVAMARLDYDETYIAEAFDADTTGNLVLGFESCDQDYNANVKLYSDYGEDEYPVIFFLQEKDTGEVLVNRHYANVTFDGFSGINQEHIQVIEYIPYPEMNLADIAASFELAVRYLYDLDPDGFQKAYANEESIFTWTDSDAVSNAEWSLSLDASDFDGGGYYASFSLQDPKDDVYLINGLFAKNITFGFDDDAITTHDYVDISLQPNALEALVDLSLDEALEAGDSPISVVFEKLLTQLFEVYVEDPEFGDQQPDSGSYFYAVHQYAYSYNEGAQLSANVYILESGFPDIIRSTDSSLQEPINVGTFEVWMDGEYRSLSILFQDDNQQHEVTDYFLHF